MEVYSDSVAEKKKKKKKTFTLLSQAGNKHNFMEQVHVQIRTKLFLTSPSVYQSDHSALKGFIL